MPTAWLIDGLQLDGVPPDDRGLAYGDGLFETIAAPGGRPRHFDRHIGRLRASCARLGFAPPVRSDIEADIERLAPTSGDYVIKIIVTRGSGGRGYRPPAEVRPRRLVGVFPWPDYPPRHYTNGIRVILCTTRLAENPLLAGMKHLCRLEQVMAQREVAAAHAQEGLMLSTGGRLVSGTMSNLFMVVDSALVTPRLERCGVAGVMRAAVIDAVRSQGIELVERDVDPDMVQVATEVFLSNSVFGIWPVCELDDIAFSVGALTQSLMRQLGIYPR